VRASRDGTPALREIGREPELASRPCAVFVVCAAWERQRKMCVCACVCVCVCAVSALRCEGLGLGTNKRL